VGDRLYISAASADVMEKEFPQLFLSLGRVHTPLELRIYAKEGRKKREILDVWITSNLKFLWIWEGAPKRLDIDHSTFLFLKIWGKIGQDKDRPLELKFSKRGRSSFVPPFDYYGIFTEKTFDLTIRNALYVAQSFRDLVELVHVEFGKIINANKRTDFLMN